MPTLDDFNGYKGKAHTFYTIGYGKASITGFIDRLKRNEIKTVIDTRKYPRSEFKPEFSKNNLTLWLNRRGIKYIHVGELGVPRDKRNIPTKEIWRWYDSHATKWLSDHSIDYWFEHGEPVAIMCAEQNPKHCHRHRLARILALKGHIFEHDLSDYC